MLLQHLLQLFLQQGIGRRIRRGGSFLVFDKVTQMGIFFFANRSFQGNRFLGNLLDFPHPFHRHIHFLGNFFWGRFPAQFLQQLAGYPYQLVDGFYHVDRNPDGPRLVGNGPGNGLANPPGCVRTEFKALVIVEFFYGLD